MIGVAIVALVLAGSFLGARVIKGWRNWAELSQGTIAGGVMGAAAALLAERAILAIPYVPLGAALATAVLWLVGDQRLREPGQSDSVSRQVLRKAIVFIYLLVGEFLVITILWLTHLISPVGLWIGGGVFLLTLLGLVGIGLTLRRQLTSSHQ